MNCSPARAFGSSEERGGGVHGSVETNPSMNVIHVEGGSEHIGVGAARPFPVRAPASGRGY